MLERPTISRNRIVALVAGARRPAKLQVTRSPSLSASSTTLALCKPKVVLNSRCQTSLNRVPGFFGVHCRSTSSQIPIWPSLARTSGTGLTASEEHLHTSQILDKQLLVSRLVMWCICQPMMMRATTNSSPRSVVFVVSIQASTTQGDATRITTSSSTLSSARVVPWPKVSRG